MAPCRTATEDNDPVTAEYDIYLTPSVAEKLFLLQYPNRLRHKAYNANHAACPTEFRIKPKAGYLEMDVLMNPEKHFNKYRGLQWGEALRTVAATSASTTFGPAGGLASGPRGRTAGAAGVGAAGGVGARGAVGLKDDVDRENEMLNRLAAFEDSVDRGYVHRTTTLGGQILSADDPSAGQANGPRYMLGAFRGGELHLTPLSGVVQMRPQFHHVDAETQRARLAASRSMAADAAADAAPRAPPAARGILQSMKEYNVERQQQEKRPEDITRELLRTAQEEDWTRLQYFDEDEVVSYEVYENKLFVRETWDVPDLKSAMDDWEYLDAISAPRKDARGRRKKRDRFKSKRKSAAAAAAAAGAAAAVVVPAAIDGAAVAEDEAPDLGEETWDESEWEEHGQTIDARMKAAAKVAAAEVAKAAKADVANAEAAADS